MATTARAGLLYVWAAPTTAIGLVAVALVLITRGQVRIVDGVIEAHGGVIRWMLARCVPIRGGALAMTLGHVVIGQSRAALGFTRAHEHAHVRQCERWGPLFIPAYLVASLIALARGRDPYHDNAFEREACKVADACSRSGTELLRVIGP